MFKVIGVGADYKHFKRYMGESQEQGGSGSESPENNLIAMQQMQNELTSLGWSSCTLAMVITGGILTVAGSTAAVLTGNATAALTMVGQATHVATELGSLAITDAPTGSVTLTGTFTHPITLAVSVKVVALVY